jgi:hypothetical protein
MHRKAFHFPHIPERSQILHCCEHASVKSLSHTRKSVITFSVGSVQDDQTQLFQMCVPVNQREKNVAVVDISSFNIVVYIYRCGQNIKVSMGF